VVMLVLLSINSLCESRRESRGRTSAENKIEILVEQQPPQGVFVCDHAGLVINNLSLTLDRSRCMQLHVRVAYERGFMDYKTSMIAG